MLLEQEHRPITAVGLMQTAKATIKASPKIFGFFSDSTYQNKPLAIARELAANAIDAHTAAGNPDPIEVWLPNDFDPTFRVRDRGTGMSHSFMMNEYMALGESSTKDGSNDQIGGFGIGHWAPFAMVDQYTVRSTHNGTTSIYSVFKDETGMPSIGLLGQRQDNEPNGVEISFPVASHDFGTFANAANEALKYFYPLPIVHNGEIDAPEYVVRGANWAIRPQQGEPAIIMGGVRYLVSRYNVSYEVAQHKLFQYGLDLTLPIGACAVALSREGLSYNDKTNKALEAALDAVVDDVAATFGSMFDQYPTLWEAKQALCREVPVDQTHGARGKFLLEHAKYQGKPLTPHVTLVGGTYWQIDSRSSYRRRGSGKVGSAQWEAPLNNHQIRLDQFEHVILDDLPQSPKSKTIQRIKLFIDEECHRRQATLVLRDPKFDITIPKTEFVLTSELEAPEASPKAVRGARPKVRLFQASRSDYLRNFRPDTYANRHNVNEIAYQNQPATGILAVGENFGVDYQLLRKLELGLIPANQIYYTNRSDAAKLKSWVKFEDAFQAALEAKLAAHPTFPQAVALRGSALSEMIQQFAKLPEDQIKKGSIVERIANLHNTYIKPIPDSLWVLHSFITSSLPPRVEPVKIKASFEAKHPHANRLLQFRDFSLNNAADRALFLKVL